ncbi:PDZ and LIM domain protein 7-like [Plutella xylostella]|uniref:PDZ and LIM domain protein 7-like n=1 Tax=Plutella xylostella TaxID=51655 RepID=UPI0020330E3E|nr:PDZ and LIM domain protein 7-like [Plutella xylostella]
MSLGIRLRRGAGEAWGFRLVGGSEFQLPLTVVKVQLPSPASRAGLRDGDCLVSISGAPAAAMTHDAAHHAISQTEAELLVEVMRRWVVETQLQGDRTHHAISQTGAELLVEVIRRISLQYWALLEIQEALVLLANNYMIPILEWNVRYRLWFHDVSVVT